MNYMKYNRSFVMMEQQGSGFSAKEGPVKGYLKVETGNNKGALRCVVQNLRPYGRSEYIYKLIFFGKKRERTIHAVLGGLVINRNGSGETYFRFDPLNFDGKGNRYDEFSVAIVAAASARNGKEPLHPILKGSTGFGEEEDDGGSFRAEEETEVSPKEAEDGRRRETRAGENQSKDQVRDRDGQDGAGQERPERDGAMEPQSDPPTSPEGLTEKGASHANYDHFYNEYLLHFCNHTCQVAGYYEDVSPFEKDKTGARWKKVINVGNLPLVSPGAHYFATQYRHYLFGARPDENGRAERYYFAVPGRFMKEEQPDGGRSGFLCWQPVKGAEGPGTGYGYWIVAVNAVTGHIEEA